MKNTGCLILVLLAVAALVAYDQYRIEQMRQEVLAISGKVYGTGPAKAKGKNGEQRDLVTALAEAERYTKKAQELIDQKRAKEAQAQLDKALARLKSANGVSKDIVGDTAQYLGKTRDNAIKVFQKAWNDISEEAKPKE